MERSILFARFVREPWEVTSKNQTWRPRRFGTSAKILSVNHRKKHCEPIRFTQYKN
jgi:hypothetical protein